MKKYRSLLIVALAGLILSSCSPKIPFTQSIREQYKLKENDLKVLQFYNSHEIVLNRAQKSAQEQETVEGTLTITNDRSLEQIVIKAGTPGVVLKVPGTTTMGVSFEVGDETALVFGTSVKGDNERYSLMAPEWENNRGKIQYAGKLYYTSRGSGGVHLLFKMQRLSKYIRKQRVVKGRKI
ncbi:MAG TPA: hypothetical protein EYN51_00020 [Flavobacteriales bacterium]|nr:hypothetical protein [Flavobacteriales bacterium]HIA11511.1 hypothetical protein [Flavobacteriales bacterium]